MIRESSYLGTPTVDIGTRHQGREKAQNVYHVPHLASEITRAIRHQLDQGRYEQSTLYGTGDAGRQIANSLVDPSGTGIAADLECRSGEAWLSRSPVEEHPPHRRQVFAGPGYYVRR